MPRGSTRKIIAEVWERPKLGIAGTKPFSRHTSVERALGMIECMKRNWPMATDDYFVVLVLTPDGSMFVPYDENTH